MKKTFVLVLCVLVAIVAVQAEAGTATSDGFTVYGYELPQLRAGEYLLSARGTVSSSEFVIDAAEPDFGYTSEQDLTFFDFTGVYAATDHVFLRVGLSYYPEQTVQEVDYVGLGSGADFGHEQDSYVRPDLGLVIRPSRALELYGTWSREVAGTEYTEGYFYEGSASEVTTLRFGVNYFGRL